MRIDLSTHDILNILIEKFGEKTHFKLWLNEDGQGWETRTGKKMSDFDKKPDFKAVVVEMGRNCGTVLKW